MSRGRRAAWVAGYGIVTFLSFPHPLGGVEVDLGAWLAWLSPALLVVATADLTPRRAALWGLVAGLGAHAAILHWIWIVTVVYGHAHPALGLLGPLGLGLYVALFTAAFAGLRVRLVGAGLASPLVGAALWAALDHARSFVFTGFPWATLGYAQWRNPALLGWAPYTGVYGLSFLTALVGIALAEAGFARREGRRIERLPWAVAALALAAGALGFATTAPDPGPTVRIAVLQGNIDQGVKWTQAWFQRTLDVYEDLSRRAVADGAEVVVWPETAVPGVLGEDASDIEAFSRLAAGTGAAYVLGAVGVERGPGPSVSYYDSAFLVSPAGDLLDRYDKTHLVPFGEYLPFRDWLGRFFRAVAQGVATTGVTAGERPRATLLALPGGASLPAGVPICYELLFPDLVRRFVVDGAEILLAITNDAWYGRTGAPYQFLAITALRSAENRVWTARAANTGVSAIIDARGRVVARTRIFEPDSIVADVPRRPAPAGGSFYSRHGDWFAGACWAAVAGTWIVAARRERRRNPT